MVTRLLLIHGADVVNGTKICDAQQENRPRIATIAVNVLRALDTVGSLKRGTPLLTASTPVIAVQPLAKAPKSSHALTVAVPCGLRQRHDRDGMATALPGAKESDDNDRLRCIPINTSTGTTKASPDSRTPRRLMNCQRQKNEETERECVRMECRNGRDHSADPCRNPHGDIQKVIQEQSDPRP